MKGKLVILKDECSKKLWGAGRKYIFMVEMRLYFKGLYVWVKTKEIVSHFYLSICILFLYRKIKKEAKI